jgi:uncharacterized membrane protein
MTEIYKKYQIIMLIHTTTGSLALFIGSLQFINTIKQKYTHIHKLLGKIYVILLFISIISSFVYLMVVKPSQVFTGLPFYINLLTANLLTLQSCYQGYVSVK